MTWRATSVGPKSAGLGVLGLNFRVMLRKRPLLAWELDAEEFDVVTCERARRRVTLHDGQMARNGRWGWVGYHTRTHECRRPSP